MSGSTPDSTLLTTAHVAFMQGAVSINVGARDANNLPTVTRAYGCTVSPDGRQVRLFVYPAHNERLLQHILENRVIAAVFSRPSTHQTIQLKGRDAALDSITSADIAVMQHYRRMLAEELNGIGFPATFTGTMLPPATNDAVVIRFTPLQAFTQTPGPQAGQKLTT